MHGDHRRQGPDFLRLPGLGRRGHHGDHRRGTARRGPATPGAAGVPRRAGGPVRLLHLGNDRRRGRAAGGQPRADRTGGAGGAGRQPVPLRRARQDRGRGAQGGRAAPQRAGRPVTLSPREAEPPPGAQTPPPGAQTPPPGAETSSPGARTPPPSLAAISSLAANPVLSSWLALSPGGTVTIFSGKVEYGQGVWTALAQIAAEELDVALPRITVAPVSTDGSPDEGVTSGSLSIQHSGSALRQAGAQPPALLLAAAASKLRTAPTALTVDDGQILAAGRPTGLSYWSLASPGLLDRAAGAPVPVKPPGRWSVAGRSAPRIDLPDKVTGRPRFLHDLVLTGMHYGRVVRPPALAAELLSTGDPTLPPDVRTVRDGSLLGVVAPTDAAALRAARLVAKAARWHVTESLPDDGDLKRFLLSSPAQAGPGAPRPRGGFRRGRTHDPHRRVHPPVPRARLDGAQLRDSPLGRRGGHGVEPQPGGVRPA